MILENIALALSAIKANKMRSVLTMLGIIIGIMSVIAIVIVGDAMTASVTTSFSSFGAGNITVSIQEKSEKTDGLEMARQMSGGETVRSSSSDKVPESSDLITEQMIKDMRDHFGDDVLGVSYSYSSGSATVKDEDLSANISITGTNAEYDIANSITLLSGRYISDSDVSSKSQTAVVSDKFVSNMFPNGTDPLGQKVKVYKADSIVTYTIVGVYEYEQNGFMGSTASDENLMTSFYIPVTTAKLDLLEKNYNNFTIITAEDADVNTLTNQIQVYFDKLYASNKTWKASASNMSSMLETISSTLSTVSIAIAFIAGISLIVGGIGVMNIMLVSVTERTREIGTRKALGAKSFDIKFQFVMEAGIISLVGGIIGIILGVIIGILISIFLSAPLTISAFVVIGSALFSMGIGVFFGWYPASQAAKLDPIEALRYE